MCDFCPPSFCVRPDAKHEQCRHPYVRHGAIYKTVVVSKCDAPKKKGQLCRCMGTEKQEQYVRIGCLVRGCKCEPDEKGQQLGSTYKKNGVEYNRYGFAGRWSD